MAAIRKLIKHTVRSGGVEGVTQYAGNIVYEGGRVSYILTEEGRLVADYTNPPRKFLYEYSVKDHLGNTRAVFMGSDLSGAVDIVQKASYYPFGLIMKRTDFGSASYPKNNYLYNGKELNSDKMPSEALNWYDYGARFYDPQIGRFITLDRFTEKYLDFTPYQYAANNPVKYLDFNGDSIKLSDAFLNNKTATAVMKALLNTEGGRAYLSKFAYKGETVLGVVLNEKGDQGEYNDKGIDLNFVVKATSGDYFTGADDKKKEVTITSHSSPSDESKFAQGLTHELFLESKYLADDLKDNGEKDYSNISTQAKNAAYNNPWDYGHQQNKVDRAKIDPRKLLWPGTAYGVLQSINKSLNLGKTNEEIKNGMFDYWTTGSYGRKF
ncbi:MAG: RHS repeat-associated core domain-containing protein [Bacteroidales bacterium]|nr:RHS repeat-associated core domain-containing protein [Bacteroidales bacterium]